MLSKILANDFSLIATDLVTADPHHGGWSGSDHVYGLLYDGGDNIYLVDYYNNNYVVNGGLWNFSISAGDFVVWHSGEYLWPDPVTGATYDNSYSSHPTYATFLFSSPLSMPYNSFGAVVW